MGRSETVFRFWLDPEPYKTNTDQTLKRIRVQAITIRFQILTTDPDPVTGRCQKFIEKTHFPCFLLKYDNFLFFTY